MNQLAKLGVDAVGISPDAPEKQKKFDTKHNLGFHLLSDEDFKVAEAYGAYGEKKSFGKTRVGVIRSSFLIDEKGKLLDVWYKVKPDDTVPNVLNFLKDE